MKTTVKLGLTAALAGVLSAGTASAGPVSVEGDPVLFWNEQLIAGLTGSPVSQSRSASMVAVAMFDAVNATLGNTHRSYLKGVVHEGGDTRAAASVAAHNVLVAINPGKAGDFAAALAASLALVPDGEAKTKGMATGAAFASAMIAKRTGDGSGTVVPYVPSGEIGRWAPTPPGFGAAVFPQWGGVDTWMIDSGDQFRPGPPPSLDSAEYAAALNEVKEIGSVGSLIRTADQAAAAQYWNAAGGPTPWLRLASDLAQGKSLSTLENAQILALMTSTQADATIALFEAKYHYDYWRPVTAIRNAHLDGNDATVQDEFWTSLIGTPPHPSYVSGHSAQASSSASILEYFFGGDVPFCLALISNPAIDRCWDNFEDVVADAANSRLWGGIHFSFDNLAGVDLGRLIAAYALSGHYFDRIPEPATMGLLGLGLAGLVVAASRRRAGRGRAA